VSYKVVVNFSLKTVCLTVRHYGIFGHWSFQLELCIHYDIIVSWVPYSMIQARIKSR